MKHSSKPIAKLSKRLQHIEQMVTSQYSHIWDCCCDHGLLGFTLLSRQAASNIHFVDIIPELMAEIENKLHRFYSNRSGIAWKTHCLDVAKLPLLQYEGKHLIIIAGVGGDLMIKFLEAIHQQHQNLEIDFLLCPVHHQFSLRRKLIDLDFSLKDEVLVEDNQRFYEVLLVSSANNTASKVTAVGEKIWQSLTSAQAQTADKYLNKTLQHYQRIQQGFERRSEKGKASDVQDIIDAYRMIVQSSRS